MRSEANSVTRLSYFKDLGDKFSYISGLYYLKLFGYFWKRHFLSKNYCGHFRQLFSKMVYVSVFRHLVTLVWRTSFYGMLWSCRYSHWLSTLWPPRFSWPPWSGCRTRTGSLPPPWRPPTRGTVLSPKTVNIIGLSFTYCTTHNKKQEEWGGRICPGWVNFFLRSASCVHGWVSCTIFVVYSQWTNVAMLTGRPGQQKVFLSSCLLFLLLYYPNSTYNTQALGS